MTYRTQEKQDVAQQNNSGETLVISVIVAAAAMIVVAFISVIGVILIAAAAIFFLVAIAYSFVALFALFEGEVTIGEHRYDQAWASYYLIGCFIGTLLAFSSMAFAGAYLHLFIAPAPFALCLMVGYYIGASIAEWIHGHIGPSPPLRVVISGRLPPRTHELPRAPEPAQPRDRPAAPTKQPSEFHFADWPDDEEPQA